MTMKELAAEHGRMCNCLIGNFSPDTVASLRQNAAAFTNYQAERLLEIARNRNNRRLQRIRRHAVLAFRCARAYLRDTDLDFWSYGHLLTH